MQTCYAKLPHLSRWVVSIPLALFLLVPSAPDQVIRNQLLWTGLVIRQTTWPPPALLAQQRHRSFKEEGTDLLFRRFRHNL